VLEAEELLLELPPFPLELPPLFPLELLLLLLLFPAPLLLCEVLSVEQPNAVASVNVAKSKEKILFNFFIFSPSSYDTLQTISLICAFQFSSKT
jgi:hypothetical protein